MCFLAKVPSYQRDFKVDGIIGLAPVIYDMRDYSFLHQIMNEMIVENRKIWMRFNIERLNSSQLSIPEGQLIFYSNIEESEKPLLNTTLDLPLPLGKYGNFYNFSYPGELNPLYFNNSVLYKIGGEDGFITDTEIQGFHTYSLEEV